MNSSHAPVVLFRRRLKSDADVLKGIRTDGFTQSRWDALLGSWGAVCRHGPCGPISSLGPWDRWTPPDLHGFFLWAFDSLEVLNGFTKQVVNRRDIGVRKWTDWLREVLGSRPFAWLRQDFVPPSPFLVIKDPQTQSSQKLLSLISLMLLSSASPGCLSSVGQVILLFFLRGVVGHFLSQEPQFDLPRITGRDLREVARAKKSIAGGLDGWAWNEIKALSLPWFSGLAILLELVETAGVWPQKFIRCLNRYDPESCW